VHGEGAWQPVVPEPGAALLLVAGSVVLAAAARLRE